MTTIAEVTQFRPGHAHAVEALGHMPSLSLECTAAIDLALMDVRHACADGDRQRHGTKALQALAEEIGNLTPDEALWIPLVLRALMPHQSCGRRGVLWEYITEAVEALDGLANVDGYVDRWLGTREWPAGTTAVGLRDEMTNAYETQLEQALYSAVSRPVRPAVAS